GEEVVAAPREACPVGERRNGGLRVAVDLGAVGQDQAHDGVRIDLEAAYRHATAGGGDRHVRRGRRPRVSRARRLRGYPALDVQAGRRVEQRTGCGATPRGQPEFEVAIAGEVGGWAGGVVAQHEVAV